MKARWCIPLVFVGMALALTWAAAAASPLSPGSEAEQLLMAGVTPDFPDLSHSSADRPLSPRFSVDQPAKPDAQTPAIAIGQSGLSYRYVRTFGETERAYFDDTAHLNYPYGLTTDGNNVWIADSNGLRAVKYSSDGTFVSQIGKTGFRYGADQNLQFVADVGVDSTGNVWLVDGDVSHVLKFDAAGKYLSKLGLSYDSGQSNDRFSGPHSIAFDSAGNIYVSDSWNNRIQVFKSDGSYLATIGITGVEGSDNAHFCNPQHIAIASNVLYIADACNHRVQLFNVANPQAASYVATIGVSGQTGSDNTHFDHPLGVAVDANRIYVADENNHRVQVFSRATRAYQATISDGWGQDNAHLRHPADVAVDAAGNIYVADWLNARVQQFNSSLAYVRTYGATGVPYLTDELHYNTPSGLAVASDGSIYVTEARGQRLLKLDAGGTAQWVVGLPGVVVDTDANDRLNNPRDVALAPSGLVYVADSSNDRIQIFNPDGSYYATLGAGYGTGDYQFKGPTGLFITADGTIYVADYGNHRVQVYNSNRVYVATLGVTGVAGSDNAHFQNPRDVAVDGRGYIYVSENGNYRVQVFDANRNYVRTIGVTGEGGDGFDHLNGPHHLAVDTHNNLYVSSNWNSAVHVYNQDGAYLTTIGGSRGNRSGQLAGPYGLAFDAAGNLYIGDSDNHRIQKFAPGVPGWRQVNINGFGQQPNRINSLAPFGGQLYAGAYNWSGSGAQLWRMDAVGAWTPMITDGFGSTRNVGIDHLAEFNGQLYAGTWANTADGGGEVWRSQNGVSWERVVSQGFGDPTNAEVFHFAVFNNMLYAATWSGTSAHGTEIWRSSDGQNWTQVVSNGLGDATNRVGLTMEVFNGALYVGTYSAGATGPVGCEVWRTMDGLTWTKVVVDGFGGNLGCYEVGALASFEGYLYAGTGIWDASTQTYPGGEVWRCSAASGCDGATDWVRVATKGFNNPSNYRTGALRESGSYLYAVANNSATGMEVWRTADGVSWEQVSVGGFGDSNNAGPYWGNSVAVYNNHLYIGSTNGANGGEVWMKTLTADFTATPTRGAPPLTVQFANTSSGDFTTSQWDFGDGGTSTEKNPMHTYTASGTYTVTLTVGDGTDTSTITRSAYIAAMRTVYLPLVTRNYDPLLYDDFNDATWDGAYDSARWAFSGDSSVHFRQQGGALEIANTASSNPEGSSLYATRPQYRRWSQVRQVEARLKMSADRTNAWSPVGLAIYADEINGHTWYAHCRLGANGSMAQPSFGCSVFISQGNSYPSEYETPGVSVDYNTWHTARIETDPATATVRFYLDNMLIGSHTPTDALVLLTNEHVQVAITVWGSDPNSTATRYVDDVRITPAR